MEEGKGVYLPWGTEWNRTDIWLETSSHVNFPSLGARPWWK